MKYQVNETKEPSLDATKQKMLEDIMNDDIKVEDTNKSAFKFDTSYDIYDTAFNVTNYNKIKGNLEEIGKEISAYVLLHEGQDVKVDDNGDYYLEKIIKVPVEKTIITPDVSRTARFLRKINWEDRTIEKTVTEYTNNIVRQKLPERNVNHFVKLIKTYCTDLKEYNTQLDELKVDMEQKEQKLDGNLYETINLNGDLLQHLVTTDDNLDSIKSDLKKLSELEQGVRSIDKTHADIEITTRKKSKLLNKLKGEYINSAKRLKYNGFKKRLLESFSDSLTLTKAVAEQIYTHNTCVIDVFSTIEPAITYIHKTANIVGQSLNVISEADKGIKKFLEVTNMAEYALREVGFQKGDLTIDEAIKKTNMQIEATSSNIETQLDEAKDYVKRQM